MKNSKHQEAFETEASELLKTLNSSLIRLEKEPDDLRYVEEIFRAAHSLKGMAAMMEYGNLVALTHNMESVLDLVRRRQCPADAELIGIVFECFDALQEMIDAIIAGEAEKDAAALIERLARFSESTADQMTAAATPTKQYKVSVKLADNCVLKSVRAYMAVKRLNHIGQVYRSNPTLEDIEDERFQDRFEIELSSSFPADKIKADLEAISEVESVEVAEVASQPGTGARPKTKSTISATESQTVRISIDHLDNLIDLAGELVILRSRFEKISGTLHNLKLNDVVRDLHQLSGDLQYEVMRTRMVPVGNIFDRFPRMVRDIAKQVGKQVDFVIEGNDIELDRTVLDEIGDPIVHLLRNAVGHGIELPADRLVAGKPESGIIKLSARREKDVVVIEVSDDGAGIDPDALKQKAIDLKIISETLAQEISEKDVFDLVCRPGFTTADSADELSGRGVGMDVVKGKIEALGGILTIDSEIGKGAQFTLELPLTLAIIQALMVGSADRIFALPLGNVVEVSSVREREVKWVKDRPVMLFQDKVIPLVWLSETMNVNNTSCRNISDSRVAIIRRGRDLRGLVVEELLGRTEIVVKPITSIGSQPGIGGITVLGDGRLALVIDVRTLN